MIKKVTAALSHSFDRRGRDIGLLKPSPVGVLTAVAVILWGCDTSCVCHWGDSPTDGMARVNVQFQWDERFQDVPSGVTVLAYGSNGTLYNQFRSNNTQSMDLFLPQGEFTLVAFNQSLNELYPIWFEGFEKLDNTRITLSEMENPPSVDWISSATNEDEGIEDRPEEKDNNSKNPYPGEYQSEVFVQPCPWFALSAPQKVSISEEELMNVNRRCKCSVCCCSHLHEAASQTHSITMRLVPQTYTLKVNLSIRNITSLASVKAYVRTLNRSISLPGESINETASILLDQWQKKMISENDGVISSMTTLLSMALTEESALVIEFALMDGKTSIVEIIPLKYNVTIDPSTMTITADLDLAEPLPKVESEQVYDGFWVTVTDWGDPTDIDI